MRRFLAVSMVAASLSLLGAACASTDWEAKYLESEEQARLLGEQNEQLRQAIAENDASTEGARQELLRTQQTIDLLSKEIEGLRAAPPAAAGPDMQSELERLRQKWGNVNLTPDGNLEITLNSDVTFASGSCTLTAEGRKILDSVASELNSQFSSSTVRVVGHTDNEPIKKSPFKDNFELGAERALEVTRYFAKQHGIDAGRLVAASRGETSPVADNGSKEGRRKNRRVEIVVVLPKNLDQGGETAGS